MTEWSAYARDAIRRADLTVPADATLKERKDLCPTHAAVWEARKCGRSA